MTRCLIIEDEPMAAALLSDYIAQTPGLELCGKYHNPLEGLQAIQQSAPDLLFLDINLPQITGMQLARLLPEGLPIIFTTAYSEHALESYRFHVVDYLMKPITFDRFLEAVRKWQRLLPAGASGGDSLYVKSGKQIVRISCSELLAVEGLKDYVVLHTAKEKVVTYKRMRDLEQVLPPCFSRVHLSWIVNRDLIDRIADNQVHAGALRIPISDSYRAAFLEEVARRTL